MSDQVEFQTTNFNSKWLDNIYENIKKLEEHNRLAKEGCLSLLDYLEMPYEQRERDIGEIQYKNLRFIVNETDLLLTDLIPTDETEIEKLRKKLEPILKVINSRSVFINDLTDANGFVKATELTPFFYESLNYLDNLRRGIIKQIAPMLYIKEDKGNKGSHY